MLTEQGSDIGIAPTARAQGRELRIVVAAQFLTVVDRIGDAELEKLVGKAITGNGLIASNTFILDDWTEREPD